jgi:hypothetical protein
MCIQLRNPFYVLPWLRVAIEMPQLSPFLFELFIPQNVTYEFLVDEANRLFNLLPIEMNLENKLANIQQHLQRYINQRFL